MKKDSWAAMLSSALKEREKRPVGAGWMTIAEIIKKYSISNNTAYALSKRCERFSGIVLSGDRCVRKTWYRPKS